MPGMKIHKLSDADIERVRKFVQAAEMMLERGHFSLLDPHEQWQEMDDDDDDKIEILKIRKSIAYNEEIEEKEIDGRILAYEYLRKKYTHLLALNLLTTDVLISNCCDPMETTLEFHPSIYQNHVAPEQ